jgi:hypothetical protein
MLRNLLSYFQLKTPNDSHPPLAEREKNVIEAPIDKKTVVGSARRVLQIKSNA